MDQTISSTTLPPSHDFEDNSTITTLELARPPPTTLLSVDLETKVTPTTQDIFTLFPNFPVELRLRVWKEAYPAPRWIEICVGPDRQDEWWARRGVPCSPLFTVYHESRVEMLKTHQVLRGRHRSIFFDGEKDTLVFRQRKFISRIWLNQWTKQIPQSLLGSIRTIVWERADRWSTAARNTFSLADEDHTLEDLLHSHNREGLTNMPGLQMVQIAENGQGYVGTRLVGSVEAEDSEEYRQRKMKMKKRMEVVLGGQGGGDDDTKDDENNDGKIKCMVEVTSGKLVFEP
ncbi:hypothetical protein BKA61DRAFT_578685 [Leptodontidium sp. MPI-SDFR-AT-0119]|nr:hypothetical protein BKA61DRAFT_578685 [Leptodontidium sp. MPI-SDFR-AT-0119]